MLGRPRQGQRAAADDHEHDGRAGRHHGLEQLLLPAEEAEPHPVAELAGRGVVGQARSLAEHDDRDVGAAGELDGCRQLLVGARRDARSRCVDDLGAGHRPADGVQDRPSPGQLVARLEDLAVADDAERIDAGAHLLERLHVHEVAVVPEQVPRAVRDRPDDREPPDARRERQHAVVLQQHERLLRERPRRLRFLRGERLEHLVGGDLDIRPVEQAEPELHPEHAADRGVEQRLVHAPVGEAVRQRAPEGDGARQLGVDAGGEGQACGLAEARRQPVGRRDHLDPHVVGGDDPVEPPLVAQDRRQQLVGGVARHAVDVAVRRHDARDPGMPDRRLERDELLVAQLARARRARAPGSVRPRRGRGRPCAWPSRGRRRRGPAPAAPRYRRSRAPWRGTDPRRRSPRSGPSGGRARCRAPAPAHAGHR